MNILVVDDDLTNRLLLKMMLEKDGHTVVLAENGQQGVEVFEQLQPDMVLMDVMMPTMDGYDATRLIKARCGASFVPVIFITAAADDETLARCIQCGGDDFIGKPFNRLVLQARIAALGRIRDLYQTVQSQKESLQAHQARLNREHELAERLYERIVDGKRVAASWIKTLHIPAERFSGDLMLYAHAPSGGVNILVADVTGHGLAAAICAMPVAELFYSLTDKGFALQQLISELNKRLHLMLPVEKFVAAALLHIDAKARNLHVWNGGIPEIRLYRPGERAPNIVVESKHLPLGVASVAEFDGRPEVYVIEPGDNIIVYTDGVTETVNAAGDMFSAPRLYEILDQAHHDDGLVDRVRRALTEFAGNCLSHDDVSLIQIQCDPAAFSAQAEEQGAVKPDAKSWRLELELKADALRHTDPLPVLMQALTGLQDQYTHQSELFTVISELFNNALDHGLLGLDSATKSDPLGFVQYYEQRTRNLARLALGSIKLGIECRPHPEGAVLDISLRDSGPGFDYSKEKPRLADNRGSCGRGVELVRKLCQDLTYEGKGNVVRAHYVWRWK